MPGLEELSMELTDILLPWMGVLISIIIAIWFKDVATKFAKGLAFQLNKHFNEGDKVILDGERALIIKIGLSETVFGIIKHGGQWDGDYVWRYVPNERIPTLRLEKVVYDNTSQNNALAIDENKKALRKLKHTK